MTVLPLVIAPDPRLEKRSKEVGKVTSKEQKLMDDMLDTMYDAHGIGLAAVQVGVHLRILVMDMQENDQKEPLFIVNPEITGASEDLNKYEEGCLSFPEQRANVMRPRTITVKYLDYDGKQQEQTFDGLLATCIQHEIDHLDGVVFIDHVSKLKKDMIMRKVRKIKKQIDSVD